MYNSFYNDNSINYPFLNTWKNEFIPQKITNHLLLYDLDSQKQECYVSFLNNNSYENNLDTAIADTEIEEDQFHSKYVYNDIVNGQQDLILKLLSTINNIKSTIMLSLDTKVLVITYYSKKRLIFLKNWEELSYFPIIFSFLIFFGNDRHLKNEQ